MDQQNIETRPDDVKRPQKPGAASPGRGGRMSRQCKVTFHEAALGSVNRGAANRNAARDGRVIDPYVTSIATTFSS